MNVVSFGVWTLHAADAILFAIVVLLGALILLSLAWHAAKASSSTSIVAAQIMPATLPIPRRHQKMRASQRESAGMPSRAPPTFHHPAGSPDVSPPDASG